MLQRVIGTFVGILLTTIVLTSVALADARVALVIGNSSYKQVPALPNPRNDAADIAAVLERLNFKVHKSVDLTYGGMRRALRDFGNEAIGADIALVYFAGHGIEVNRQNYLIPIDAALKTDLDVEFEAITLDLVMSAVQQAKVLRIVLLDACRNNPFAQTMRSVSGRRSIGRGLARVEPTVGTLVSYAAKEGTTADDGKGRNSPYTKALLSHLEEPGIDVQFLFRKVRDKVLEQTNGRQEPFTYGSLPSRQIFLKSPEAKAPELSKLEQDNLAWAAVKDSEDAGTLQRFLDQNPDNSFAESARQRIELLKLRQAQERAEFQERVAWGIVKDTGNLTTLRNFLEMFPNGTFSTDARDIISALEAEAKRNAAEEERQRADAVKASKAAQEKRQQQEEAEAEAKRLAEEVAMKEADAVREKWLSSAATAAAWNLASQSNDATVLEAFIAQHPRSEHVAEARSRIMKLKQSQKITLLQPAETQTKAEDETAATTDTRLDDKQLALRIQQELSRVGCNPGQPDGKWGRKSRRALEDFARYSKLRFASLGPSQEALRALSTHKSRVCPLVCGPRHNAEGNRCVLKECPRDLELTRSGSCISKRKQPDTAPKDQTATLPQASNNGVDGKWSLSTKTDAIGGRSCGGAVKPGSVRISGGKASGSVVGRKGSYKIFGTISKSGRVELHLSRGAAHFYGRVSGNSGSGKWYYGRCRGSFFLRKK